MHYLWEINAIERHYHTQDQYFGNLARICFDSEDYIDYLCVQQEHEFHTTPTNDDDEILTIKNLCELAPQDSGGWDFSRIPSTIIPKDTRCDVLKIWGETPKKNYVYHIM